MLTMSTLEAAYSHGNAVAIRYTVDGSEPGPASPVFTQPVPLSPYSNTTVRARVFVDGVPLSVVSQAWFAPWSPSSSEP